MQSGRSRLPSSLPIFNLQLSFLLALAGLVWLASRPQPTGPAEGTTLDGQVTRTADPPRDSFRVGTFNIHGCTGADGRRDVDRVADCLKDLDFVALNEVHGPRLWESDNQAALLGRRLGVQWLFAPATRDWHTIDFGNGLLTSLPVESWQRIPLAASNGRGYRNAVLVRLRQRRADDQRALDPYRPQRRPHPAASSFARPSTSISRCPGRRSSSAISTARPRSPRSAACWPRRA